MATKTKVTVDVMRHDDASRIGSIEMPASLWALYEQGWHMGYQWPERIARAISVLTPADIERLGIDPNTVIYLES